MARWLPGLEDYFHYRNLDVSTLKELARRWKPEVYKGVVKKGAHTALADIHESIAEVKVIMPNQSKALAAPRRRRDAPAAASSVSGTSVGSSVAGLGASATNSSHGPGGCRQHQEVLRQQCLAPFQPECPQRQRQHWPCCPGQHFQVIERRRHREGRGWKARPSPPQVEQRRCLLPEQQRPGQRQRQGDAQGDQPGLQAFAPAPAGCSIRVMAGGEFDGAMSPPAARKLMPRPRPKIDPPRTACCCQMASPRRRWRSRRWRRSPAARRASAPACPACRSPAAARRVRRCRRRAVGGARNHHQVEAPNRTEARRAASCQGSSQPSALPHRAASQW
jgi:hypothetical protein